MGAVGDDGKKQGTSDASQAPSGKDTTVDGAQLFSAEKVT